MKAARPGIDIRIRLDLLRFGLLFSRWRSLSQKKVAFESDHALFILS
jgi:hypothetical protein